MFSGLKTRFRLVPAGSDPLEDPISYKHKKLGCGALMVALCVFGAVIFGALKIYGNAKAQQAAAQATLTATMALSPTPTSTPTLTASPTITPTGVLSNAFSNVQQTGPTRLPTLAGGPAAGPTIVVVTRVVAGSCPVCQAGSTVVAKEVTKIVMQTALVTTTPGPSQTPWIVTGTAEPTQTPWIIVIEITREVTSTPTETPSPTPTPTATSTAVFNLEPTQTSTLEGYPVP